MEFGADLSPLATTCVEFVFHLHQLSSFICRFSQKTIILTRADKGTHIHSAAAGLQQTGREREREREHLGGSSSLRCCRLACIRQEHTPLAGVPRSVISHERTGLV